MRRRLVLLNCNEPLDCFHGAIPTTLHARTSITVANKALSMCHLKKREAQTGDVPAQSIAFLPITVVFTDRGNESSQPSKLCFSTTTFYYVVGVFSFSVHGLQPSKDELHLPGFMAARPCRFSHLSRSPLLLTG